jgi:hypothetical protein
MPCMDEQTFWDLVDPLRTPDNLATYADRPADRQLIPIAERALDADPAWRAWWRPSGLSACELGIVAEGNLDHLRPSADIRRVDDTLRANFTCALPGTAGNNLPALAAAEVRAMFEVIRQAMSLPDLPPTPPVSALPLDGTELPITTTPYPNSPPNWNPRAT